jgi:hypothetical protein
MFSYDRETMLLVAVAVCVLGTLYIYRELKNAKNEISEVKAHSGQMAQYINALSYYEDEPEDGEEEDVKVETANKTEELGDLSAK